MISVNELAKPLVKESVGLMNVVANPGKRRGNPGLIQQETGHGFVYTALNGASIIVDENIGFTQCMKNAQIKCDLFQCPTRYAAYERAIRKGLLKTGYKQAVLTCAYFKMTIFQRNVRTPKALFVECPLQFRTVPTRVVGEYRNAPWHFSRKGFIQ